MWEKIIADKGALEQTYMAQAFMVDPEKPEMALMLLRAAVAGKSCTRATLHKWC